MSPGALAGNSWRSLCFLRQAVRLGGREFAFSCVFALRTVRVWFRAFSFRSGHLRAPCGSVGLDSALRSSPTRVFVCPGSYVGSRGPFLLPIGLCSSRLSPTSPRSCVLTRRYVAHCGGYLIAQFRVRRRVCGAAPLFSACTWSVARV